MGALSYVREFGGALFNNNRYAPVTAQNIFTVEVAQLPNGEGHLFRTSTTYDCELSVQYWTYPWSQSGAPCLEGIT